MVSYFPSPEEFAARMQARRDATTDIAKRLYREEWCVSLNMPIDLPEQMHDHVRNGGSFDEFLTTFFQELEDDIEHDLCAAYPVRAKVIEAAFAAHRAGNYVLSVPAMVAQADGIAREVARYELFCKCDRAERVADILGVVYPEDTLECLLSPLREHSEMAKNNRGTDLPGKHLRRHEIMHGVDCDYGTELVSYKAISLLSYIGLDLPKFVLFGQDRKDRKAKII